MIRLTKRDHRLLAKCAASQWLTTAQVQRAFDFPTLNATQKRLRKLSRARYLRSYQPYRMAAALHTVGSKGRRLLDARGITFDLRRKLPSYLDHLIGTNDIRIFFEQSGAPIISFFAFWELPKFNWNYPVIPDGLCTIGAGTQLTLAVEYDRGTERLEKIAKKLTAYAVGLTGFPFDAVMVVTETSAHLETLRRHLSPQTYSSNNFLGSIIDQIRMANGDAEIFTDLCDVAQVKFSLRDLVALFMRHLDVR